MKKIRRWYYDKRFGSKLRLWFLVMTLLPAAVLGVFSSITSVNAAYDQYNSILQTDLRLVESAVRAELSQAELSGIRLCSDNTVRGVLESGMGNSYLTKDFAIQKILYSYDFTASLHSVYIFDVKGGVYTNGGTAGVRQVRERLEQWLAAAGDTRIGFWAEPYRLNGEIVLPYVHTMYDYSTGAYLAAVVVNYPESRLEEITRLYADTADDLLIFNREGQTASSWNRDFCGLPASEVVSRPIPREGSGSLRCELGGERQFLVYYNSPNSSWQYAAAVAQHKVFSGGVPILAATVLTVTLCMIIGTLLAVLISGSITDPLKKLAHTMDTTAGSKLDPSFEPRYDDEIGQLARSFNSMTVRMNDSIREMLDAKEKQRQAEYTALTAQINPHFLYNTLSTIIYLNEGGYKEEVNTVASALSSLFRISISRGREYIPVRSEFEHVQSYLEIQKIRYRGQFTYTLELDPSIAECRTIKVILQPLAENALYHGLRAREETGTITIRARRDGSFIRFEVRDSGGALTEDEAFELNRYIRAQNPPDDGRGIGLRNVNERIRIAFGEECGVYVEKDGSETVSVAVIGLRWE